MSDIDATREQVDTLREAVFGDGDIAPNTVEMDRLLDYIRDRGYEIRRTSESDRSTTLAEFRERAAELIDTAEGVRASKNPEYAVDADADYHNFFRMIARGSGLTPEAVCYVLMAKHVMAIASWATGGGAKNSEDMRGRFADLHNYTLFLYSLYKEKATHDGDE